MAFYLALEGGGTRTVAGFYEDGVLVAEATSGPSNPLAYGTTATAGVIAELAGTLVPPTCERYTLLAGISGMMSETIAREIASQLTSLPGLDSAIFSTDLHPLLYANAPDSPAVLMIAGTGASVLAHDGLLGFRRFGGRGTVMGDEGSGYQIVVAALRAIARAEDGFGPDTSLRRTLPKALGLSGERELVPWSLTASKQAVAALASVVAEAAATGDHCARSCVESQAASLARLSMVARASLPGDDPVALFVQGGVVEHCELYRASFFHTINESPRMQPTPLAKRGHEAVLSLLNVPEAVAWCFRQPLSRDALSSTEGASREIPPIDQLGTQAFVDVMINHQEMVQRALRQQAAPLAALCDAAGTAFRAGGRLVYVGAGTSGRLGVLDASECPPTFGTDPEQVIGLIAGGEEALRSGVEGAEDDDFQGESDVMALGLTPNDLVIGIAASGTTPYVLAALAFARKGGTKTALLCCNPQAPAHGVDYLVALPTGPEALPGSTRLNAGTATKVALNIISTGAMAQSGYVYAGRMVKMGPSNIKLRARAVRMVVELTGEAASRCATLLEEADYEIPIAIIVARDHVSVDEARRRFASANGQLGRALEERKPS